MGMTITEKILAKASGRGRVAPDDIIEAKIDVAMINDLASPGVISSFNELSKKVWDPDRVVIVLDHSAPASNQWAAEAARLAREFHKSNNLTFYEVGRSGIAHQVMIENGHVVPGEVIVGTDSHTVMYGALGCFSTGIGTTEMAGVLATGELWFKVPSTIKFNLTGELPEMTVGKDVWIYIAGVIREDGALYKSAEYTGPASEKMSLDSRLTLCNMAVEIGGKNGIFEPDSKTIQYLKTRTSKPLKAVKSDDEAEYEKVYDFDVSEIGPQVAAPYSPANARPVEDVAGVEVDQAFIGSCANGRMEDLRMAAKILIGREVHPNVRLIVIPASQEIYQQALSEGLIEVFLKAGAAFCYPSCGPCPGIDKGVLASGDVCIASTNRNFKGRQGHPDSKTYLANAATVAASSIKGEIADPREYG
jgi:3-isopropylmalate/(R)-2-methylmalate dehydratase large subunit